MSTGEVVENRNLVSKKKSTFFKSKLIFLLAAVLPIAVLLGMVYWFTTKGSSLIESPSVPVEKLDFERIVLHPGEIVAYVRNTGPDKITVAQVAVNEALWQAHVHPSNVISRMGQAKITIPYHWVKDEPYDITIITSTGVKFTDGIEIAIPTPTPNWRYIATFALLGVYVGVIPVYLGFLWFPFLRRINKEWMNFFLSLTAGLLIFLGVDALDEAFEVAERVPGVFQGIALIVIGALLSFLVLVTVGKRTITSQASRGGDSYARLALAYMIAAGIGLHNLGEGLAIGSAYVLGEVALGAFLVIGFTIHNITEGFGIVTPVARGNKPRRIHFLVLGLVAGIPTIFGTWIGGFIYSNIWATLFFAIGAGAIFQVVYEIAKLITRESEAGIWSPSNFSGLVIGLLIMYITGLFVII